MTTEELFGRFHELLKLPRDEVEFARRFRTVIEGALRSAGIAVVSSFLQGSLAKGTMIRPLKDVDLVLVLSSDVYAGREVRAVFRLVSDALRASLARSYESLKVGEPKKYAIPIELGDDLPSFDVVLAFEIEDDESDDILIGDTETNRWETSNTREMMRTVSEANRKTGGTLIHVVRMDKNSVRQHFEDGIPGIAIEGSACRALSERMPYADAVVAVFRQAADEVAQGQIYDPTNTENLIEKLAPGASTWLDSVALEAEKALGLATSGADNEAWEWWYRVFGDPFPKPPSPTAGLDDIMTGLHVGHEAATPTRAWSRRT